MTYKNVQHYFEHNDLPPAMGDEDVDFYEAVDQLIAIIKWEKFEHFDFNYLVSFLSEHFEVPAHHIEGQYQRHLRHLAKLQRG